MVYIDNIIGIWKRRKSCRFGQLEWNLRSLCLGWNKPDQTNKVWYDIHVELKKIEKQGVEWWLPGCGGEGNGKILVSGYRLSVRRCISSGDIGYSRVFNNAVLNTWKFLREEILNVLSTKNK